VIINHLPSFLQGFFFRMRPEVSKPQFAHLWSLVLAVVVNLRSAKLLHLSAVTPSAGHRTRRGAFLSHSDWDAPALLHRAGSDLLASMKPRPGEVIELILDDTRIAKRGSKMAWLSKMWDHKLQRFVRGHVAVFAAVAFGGVVMPWRVELWKPKGQSGGPRYRKLTQIAAEMVRDFEAPAGVKVRVLFDTFYLCSTLARACQNRGFSFFSVAQRNRNFTSDNGKRRKIADLTPGLLKHEGRALRMQRSRGRRVKLRVAAVDGHLGKIGRVRMVVSKRPRGPWKRCVAIVTNERGLRDRQIVEIYERRWQIEVLFKELAQDLGLGDYQMLQTDGIVRHLHVCCLAHLLLTHQSLEGLGAQARKINEQVRLPPMSQRLTELRRWIAREHVRKLIKGDQHAKLRTKLCDYLLAA